MKVKEYLEIHKGTAPKEDVLNNCVAETGCSWKSAYNAWYTVDGQFADAPPAASKKTLSIPGAMKLTEYCKPFDLPSLITEAISEMKNAGAEVIADADMRKFCADLGGKPISEKNWKGVHKSSKVQQYMYRTIQSNSIIWGVSQKVLDEIKRKQGYHFA